MVCKDGVQIPLAITAFTHKSSISYFKDSLPPPMPITPLIEYFNQILPLDEAEVAFVQQVFHERSVRRRQFILQEGEVCVHSTFVVEGSFKMYPIDNTGKEHNL